MSGKGFIAVEPDGTCEMCGKIDELRPYGPRGEKICADCGEKNPELTLRQMGIYIMGDSIN